MTASHLMALEVPLETPSNEPDVILRFEIMDDDFDDFSDPHRDVRVHAADQWAYWAGFCNILLVKPVFCNALQQHFSRDFD